MPTHLIHLQRNLPQVLLAVLLRLLLLSLGSPGKHFRKCKPLDTLVPLLLLPLLSQARTCCMRLPQRQRLPQRFLHLARWYRGTS